MTMIYLLLSFVYQRPCRIREVAASRKIPQIRMLTYIQAYDKQSAGDKHIAEQLHFQILLRQAIIETFLSMKNIAQKRYCVCIFLKEGDSQNAIKLQRSRTPEKSTCFFQKCTCFFSKCTCFLEEPKTPTFSSIFTHQKNAKEKRKEIRSSSAIKEE